MTQPAGRAPDGTWICTDATERDAIGSGEAVQVDDVAQLITDASRHRCTGGIGVDVSAWTGAAGGAPLDPGAGSSQVKTTLAAISGASIAAPLALWNLDGTLVEEVVGGAGRDLTTPGFSGQEVAWNQAKGLPGSGDLIAAWFDGESTIETTGGGVPGVFGIETDLTVQAWVRRDEQAAASTNDDMVFVAWGNRSSTTIGSTTAPNYRLGLSNVTIGTTPGQAAPFADYYDNQGSPALVRAFMQHTDGRNMNQGRPLSGEWIHLCMTRLRNGADDNDLRLYVNGEEVDSNLAQLDPGSRNSANMRLLIGAGRGSSRETKAAIRDVAIWTSALSAANVRTLYQIGVGEA